ncbi:MAG: amidohydrolase family protein [bacterium]|nr:amidohydrolase family protein [bacterium]
MDHVAAAYCCPMTTPEFHLRNAVVMTGNGPSAADVHVRDGRVVDLHDRNGLSTVAAGDVDAAGLWLLPGGVDPHVHFGMPLRDGLSSRGWRESSTAALLGGTTTVIDFANPSRGEPIADAVLRWQAAADGACLCDWGLHATVCDIAPERLAELDGLVHAGVPTFKAFLAYKGRLMLAAAELRLLMRQVKDVGGHLLLHAEDGEMNAAAEAILAATGRTGPEWHPTAHGPESEVEAIRQAMLLAEETGCPLTVVHLSTAAGLDLIRGARAVGVDLRAETCPQYLFRDESLYARGGDDALTALMAPPLRSPADAAALLGGLADGDIAWLATDHCAFPLETKRREAAHGFAAVPNGTAGVGERLLAAYTLGVCRGLLTPERWVRVCCEAPAGRLGLAGRKGRVAAGYDADLVLFDPEATGTHLPIDGHPDPSLWTGDDWCGRIVDVWRRGEQVVRDGKLVPGVSAGVFLPRHLSD